MHKKAGTLAQSEAQRISDAKPRTSLRSYWHTLLKKKEQTPLKTRVRYNKAISVHLLTEPYVDVTAHTAPSQLEVTLSPSSHGSVDESTSIAGNGDKHSVRDGEGRFARVSGLARKMAQTKPSCPHTSPFWGWLLD